MKKVILFLVFVISTLLNCLNIYAEEEKSIESIDSKMRPVVEAMKAYTDALVQDYKVMSKYRKPYYTYDKSIVQGVAFISDKDDNGNFSIVFYVKNNTKNTINLKRVLYQAIKDDGSIYRLEKPIAFNEGVADSFILNPEQAAYVYLSSPFRSSFDLTDIKEMYIKFGGKRIFFVPEDKIEEYSKLENRILRHLRNLWWNIK